MFAIVDVTQRATRGKILMLLEDQETAMALARDLARRTVAVVVRPLTAQEVDQVRNSDGADAYAVA